jgi:diguanylate cyclase (GGDEF)-like protein
MPQPEDGAGDAAVPAARLHEFRRSLLDLVREALTTLDAERFYRRLLARAVDVIPGAQSGSMILRDADDRYRFVAAEGYDLEALREVRFPAWLAGFEHPEGDPDPRVVVRPPSTPPALGEETVRALTEHGREGELAAVLVVPLLVSGRTRAFLTLDSHDREDAFDQASVEMARVFTDVAAGLLQRFDLEAELQTLAFHDPLTGLPNRTAFERLLSARDERRGETAWSVLIVDLVNLKPVNDSFGHAAGDEVVRVVARRIEESVPTGTEVARMGGDEFAVLVDGPETAALAAGRAVLAALEPPIQVAGHHVVVSAGVGVAVHPEHGAVGTELVRRADIAMMHAKARTEGETLATFDPAMEAAPRERLLLEEELRSALERGQFELHYQPRVAASDRRIVGVEALVRWRHPERGLVPPGLFVPLAEQTPLIHPLGRWILEEAVSQAARWRAAGHASVRLAVNLSPRQLERADLVDQVADVLRRHDLPADALEVEVLESVAMTDVRSNAERLATLRRLGVGIALDDFGMGHSSLAYLRELPLDTIKIDRAFLEGLARDGPNRAIVAATVLIGRTLGRTVVAEGVETEEQFAAVRDLGVDQAQGYGLARPQPADVVDGLIAAGSL